MIINDIENEIKILTNKNDEYNNKLNLLNRLNPLNFNMDINIETSLSSLIFTSVISSNKYKSLSEVEYLIDEFSEFFDAIDSDLYDRLAETEISFEEEELAEYLSQFDDADFFNKKTKDLIRIYSYMNDEIRKILIIIWNINNIKDQSFLASIELNKEFSKEQVRKGTENFFRDFINDQYNVEKINETLEDVLNYKKQLKNDIKNNNRQIQRLKELKDKLVPNKEQKEITKIDDILKLTPEKFKYDILKYIADYNKVYYDELEKEYFYKRDNSKARYINLFNKYNIDLNIISDEQKKLLFDIPYEEVENIIKFLERLELNISLEYIIYTNDRLIKEFSKYIEQGILTRKFLSNNVILFTDPNKYNDSKYNLFCNNFSLLSNHINIKNINEDSLIIYLYDTNLLANNINILMKYKIKYNNLKDYRFLGEENLENKIVGLKENGINFSKNIEAIYSDIDILKRLKVCKILNINIYDKDNKILDEILYKDKFSMNEQEINEFLFMHEFTLEKKKKIESM